MRANAERSRRFEFDTVVEAYDLARPRFDHTIIAELIARAGLEPGDHILEVGAGTGQLTGTLLRADLRVDALEPGSRMAEKLRQNLGGNTRLRVIETPFEDFASGVAYEAIVAANAFHWLDPNVSYRKAQSLLKPNGVLALIWNLPILADRALQARLNSEAFVGPLQQFRREPFNYMEALQPVFAAGREELMQSGCFAVPEWTLVKQSLALTPRSLVDLLNTFANGIGLRAEIEAAVLPLIAARASLELDNYIYLSVARRL